MAPKRSAECTAGILMQLAAQHLAAVAAEQHMAQGAG